MRGPTALVMMDGSDRKRPTGRDTELIRVAIVDDHPIARRGVAAVLADTGGFDVLASVGSPTEFAAWVADAQTTPDVVILDLYHDVDPVQGGHRPGLDAVAALANATQVLVMSASGAPDDVLGAVRAGAKGYISKQAQPAQFATAVETVAAGGFWLSSQLADILQTLLTQPPPEPSQPQVKLSPREEQALDLIARGFTHAQTATRMGVSKGTVDTYVERIRAKLQVGNKAELIRAALGRLDGNRR
ncbi:response regulator [Nonomuraea sp. CA-141351]|uniref:response regulator n=1 Tax=Nonomuraea sp. CA-141351 TaxID=3239996 RepID=UPI003D911DA7